MVIRISKTWISCVLLLTVAAAFEVKVVPPAARLKEWKAGENLLMSCTVVGDVNSDVSFTWLKDGTALGADNGRIKTVQMPDAIRLMIMKPVADDAGTYVCKVTADGETEETTVEVTIIMPPTFVDAPLEQHPEENSDAKIVCRVEATPAASLVWQRKGKTLEKDSERGYEFEENDQVLVIPKFRAEEDDGIYSCLAFQEPNMDSREINVTGYSAPTITHFAKVEENGFEGQELHLVCQGIGKPTPEYKWFKGSPDDKGATPLEPTDKYEFPEPGALTIQALIEDDAGQYTCVASNDIAEARNSTEVKIFRKPKIAVMENVTATQGMKVELVCKYEGDGEVTAKWIFKGESIEAESSDSKPVSQHVDVNDDSEDEEGPYDEQYANAGADEDSNNVVKRKRHARSGRFSRHADATDEDEENEDETKHMTVTEGENSLTLTLVDVRLDDAAEYQCEATNEAGTDNRRVFLAITHAPSLVRKTDETVRSYPGHSASFFCEVSAVPAPKWTWTDPNNNVILSDAEHYFIETTENGLKSSLKLKSTEKSQYGTYKCSASNDIGTPVESEVVVLQVVPPPVPSALTFDGEHPNFATITIDNFDSLSESEKPTEIILFYADSVRAAADDFEWSECETATLRYEQPFELSNLSPSTEYRIRARSKNEAGESDLSAIFTYTTSSPIAPAKPEFTRDSDDANAECGEVCEIKWTEPNDHGADIVRYELKRTPVELNDDGTYTPIGAEVSTDITDGSLSEELEGLLPNTYYNIQLIAVNDVGVSEPAQMIIHTSDEVRAASGLSVGAIIGIVALVLLVLLIIVDLACYILNRCGVLACICVNCCGQTPSERKSKEVTMEEGAKPESAQLLTGGKTTMVVETTVRRTNY